MYGHSQPSMPGFHLIIIPYFDNKERCSERPSNLPEVTQLVSDRARIVTHDRDLKACTSPSLSSGQEEASEPICTGIYPGKTQPKEPLKADGN